MTGLKRRLLDRVGADLEEIEAALNDNLTPYLELVSKTARHILFSGGKRLRPLLMVLCARLCGYRGKDDKKFSTIFEYLHAATLLHDDLVDGAAVRRGKPAAYQVYGSPTAVLVGDFLLARSLSIAADTGRLAVIQAIAAITENMSQGEIQQLENKGRISLTESEYRTIIENKTAGLIRGACRVGALIARAPDSQVERLSDFGYHLGVAFQMADDLLDYTADSRQLGKRTGADLREGKLTLPLIHTLHRADPDQREWIAELVKRQAFSSEEFLQLVALLERYGGIDYTRQSAARSVETAKAALEVFSPSESRDTLAMIADYALARKS
ncbi:MAG: polyprenyl synthetase family protein [Desulfobacterales bacterium]|jgi:octaprenyl-diphosphate synthase